MKILKYAIYLAVALVLFYCFDWMMDQDAKRMCDNDATATEAVCRQAYGE